MLWVVAISAGTMRSANMAIRTMSVRIMRPIRATLFLRKRNQISRVREDFLSFFFFFVATVSVTVMSPSLVLGLDSRIYEGVEHVGKQDD